MLFPVSHLLSLLSLSINNSFMYTVDTYFVMSNSEGFHKDIVNISISFQKHPHIMDNLEDITKGKIKSPIR